jgi:predicted nucleic acid-binding protein
MNGRTFIDTNILIYAYDVDAKEKHSIARKVLTELWEAHSGVLSAQVLQEFYVNVTRKLSKPLSRSIARDILKRYSLWCVDTTPEEILTASRIEDECRINFWDALICASALKARAERILSEDLNPGQKISGVHIENPFVQPTQIHR